MSIEFKDGAVCYAYANQFYVGEHFHALVSKSNHGMDFIHALKCSDFQLNTIKQGDYIEASELDTEQRYNDAVEVFGLFGFYRYDCADFNETHEEVIVVDCDGDFIGDYMSANCKRKITFNQLMVIGELKRLEIERDKEPLFGKIEYGSMNLVKSNFSGKPNDCKDGGKYHREIIGLDGTKTTVDVYRILDAFKTGCAATDHAVKKMLCAGLRGHKDKLTDYDNAIESLQAAKELLMQKSNNENTN